MYLYVGKKGLNQSMAGSGADNFNGGGGGGIDYWDIIDNGAQGGGATDIRITPGLWNDSASLRSRIMVAGAGGGRDNYDGNLGMQNTILGYGGGLIGGDGSWGRFSTSYSANLQGYGGTQTSGGANNNSYITSTFGVGAKGLNPPSNARQVGSGGGYYGGGGGMHGNHASSGGGGGGSSYISGHTGSVAITSANDQMPKTGCTTGTIDNKCSLHYSGYKFTNTIMIDGAGYNWTNVKTGQVEMPKPDGTFYPIGHGHVGNGHIKVTLITKS